MSGWTNQKKHLRKIRMRRSTNIDVSNVEEIEEVEKVDMESNCNLISHKPSPVECAFAALVSGNTFTSAREYSIHLNQQFTSKACFYKAQAVQQYADESMEEALKSTQDNSIFSGDGHYPIRRNSSHCSFDIINTDINKVVALGIVDKKSFHHPEEDFELTYNMLETEAMKRALHQIQH